MVFVVGMTEYNAEAGQLLVGMPIARHAIDWQIGIYGESGECPVRHRWTWEMVQMGERP